MNRRKKNNANGLNSNQHMAIDLILSGMSDREIAEELGLSRQSVNSWRNRNEQFRQALQDRRNALIEVHQGNLNSLVGKAIKILQDAMENGDRSERLKAALQVLRISGLQGFLQSSVRQNDSSWTPKQRQEAEKELLCQAIGEASRELGYRDPTEE